MDEDKDRFRVSSDLVRSNTVEFLTIPKVDNRDEMSLKQELLIVARVDFGYDDATLDDIELFERDGREYYCLVMDEEVIGTGYNTMVYSNVVPVEVFLP